VPAVSYQSVVPFPPAEVFAWHERPGALRRLLPPWLRLEVLEEPASLRDGRAVLSLPGGVRWALRHGPYGGPFGFREEAANLPSRLAGWEHTRLFSAEGEGSALVVDRARSRAPAHLMRQVLAYAHRQVAADLSAHAQACEGAPSSLRVAITGPSGLIGSELAAFLTSGGHRVVRLVRRPPRGPDERRWDPPAPAAGLLAGIDAVVHLAGAPIGRRFSERHKRAVWESRVGPTERLAEAAAREAAEGDGPRCFVCASAVGFYGPNRGDEALDEESGQGEGFLAGLVAGWEAATQPAAEAGLRVVNVRTGVVQSPQGGVLGLLYPLFLAGLGARLGNGRQWLSWVAIDDLLDIYLRALVDPRLSGPVNAVGPAPVTNADYTAVLARVLRRPAFFSVPPFAVGLVLGAEGSREFALASQRAVPAVLDRLGHRFRYPELAPALRHVLGRWEAAGR
jgi:uncharacterized protein (TIGR01777 family)